VNDCTACGVRFYNGWSNTLYGLNIVGNADLGGVSFEGHDGTLQQGNSIIGCYMESNNPADVRIVSNSNKIMNCFLGTTPPIQWITGGVNYFGNVAFGNRFVNVADEETLYLGDQYQLIRGEAHIGAPSGLIFQTFHHGGDVNAFRWKGKAAGGTVYELMTLKAYTGRLGINNPNPQEKIDVNGNIKTSGQVLLGNVRFGAGSSLPSINDADWQYRGSLFIKTSDGKLYINTEPDSSTITWTVVGNQS